MIKDDLHWKSIMESFMRDDLLCGPMEFEMPAQLFYPARQWFNHVE